MKLSPPISSPAAPGSLPLVTLPQRVESGVLRGGRSPYYQAEGVTIYHGNALEMLDSLPPVNLLLTDPPYGIALENHAAGKERRKEAFSIAGDKCQSAGLQVLEWAAAKNLATVVFASPRKPWPGEWRNWLVWDKGGAVGGGGDTAVCWKQSWELIQVARNGRLLGKRDESVIRHWMTPQDSRLHPAQKPVGLLLYLLGQLVTPGAVVLDPFMGSGSTLRAAKDMNCRAIGIEIEERYCEIAANRLAQSVLPLGGGGGFENLSTAEKEENIVLGRTPAKPPTPSTDDQGT